MKRFRIPYLVVVFLLCWVGSALSEMSPEEKNIQIVQSLEIAKQYKFPTDFGLINARTKIIDKHRILIYCNNDNLLIRQSDAGSISSIIIREPSVSLYGMKIQQTLWNDPLVENPYLIKKEFSPNGKTMLAYYRSETNRNMQYVAFFFSDSYKNPPILLQFEKIFVGDPC